MLRNVHISYCPTKLSCNIIATLWELCRADADQPPSQSVSFALPELWWSLDGPKTSEQDVIPVSGI